MLNVKALAVKTTNECDQHTNYKVYLLRYAN